MSKVYPECTVCSQTLTDAEKKYNEDHEIFYHPICDDCLESKTHRIFEIVEVDPEDELF